jgi:alanyl-tRNA synthetase
MLTGNEIRETFLKFFEGYGHRRVRSSSLVPHGDPTLLFTNAGMNQFKNVFLGLEQRDYKRATTAQKCVRAGGKHNDLENVGFTNRHHTFFEMLGNFSFGDYFKKDAIAFACELVTSPKWFGIPKETLYATIFQGSGSGPGDHDVVLRDSEAFDLWKSQGVGSERISEGGLEDNFWQMGDTGPCGPCSEIHYDMGAQASERGHTDCRFPCDCGRYVEIWNLVFMQYSRYCRYERDGFPSDWDAEKKKAHKHSGGVEGCLRLDLLPKPCVDTGMGLERIAAALLNVRDPRKFSNYETDLFQPLIRRAEELTGTKYGAVARSDASLRIIADHSRATAFLIADGVLPSNEGRGYVLRKIMRRALRHGHLLKPDAPVLTEMIPRVQQLMGGAYPELVQSEHLVRIVAEEQARFRRALESSLEKLEDDLRPLSAFVGTPSEKLAVYAGEKAFKLYDTYGLPRDFIEDACRDLRVRFDTAGFDRAMEEQRARAKASWKGVHKEAANPVYAKLAETFKTESDFYYGATSRDCRIEAIVTKQGLANEIPAGAEAEIVLDRTTFYAESGGQTADIGKFFDNSESQEVAEVRGAYYPVAGLIAHRIVAKDKLAVGDRIATLADGDRREHIKRNHTATHLMHAALRNILGTHVKQSGSLVAPDHLRFDFTHFRNVDPAELREIEQQVNEQILLNHEIATDVMAIDDALASGALAFFGDRYPESNVRVVTVPDAASPRGFYSKELCGGTHTKRTGELGVFKFVAEQSIASGIRRVEAITGARALEHFQDATARLRALAAKLNASDEAVEAAVERLEQQSRQLEKQLEAIKKKSAHSKVDDLVAGARLVQDVRVLSSAIADADRETLRQLVDTLRQKLGSGVVVLGTTEDGKVALVSGVTKDLTAKLHAGKIIQAVAKQVGGSGGGRPDLAEAGGKDPALLDKALAEVYEIVGRMLSSS